MIRRPLVVDTNVVVAGLITRDRDAPTARILDAMLAGRVVFLLSEPLLGEYRAVLNRPRIFKRHQLSEVEIDRILVEIAGNAIVREPQAIELPAGNPADAHLWALARTHEKALLVTGDEKVRSAAPSWGEAVSPRALVEG